MSRQTSGASGLTSPRFGRALPDGFRSWPSPKSAEFGAATSTSIGQFVRIRQTAQPCPIPERQRNPYRERGGGEANQVPEKHPPNCTLPHRPPHGFEYATRADFQAFCIHRQVLSTPMCRFGRTLGPILPMLAEIGPILAIAIRIRPIVFPKSAKFGQHPLPVHPTRPEPSLGSVSR